MKCPHANKCSSYGKRCGSCRHNPEAPDDYYEPRDYWQPWWSPYPYDQWRITCDKVK